MAEVRKIFLLKIAGMIVRRNREMKDCYSLEEVSVSGDGKDDFVKK